MAENVNVINEQTFVWEFYHQWEIERAIQDAEYISPEYVEAREYERVQYAKIVSATDAEAEISAREALSAYTKCGKELKSLYDAGDREGFDKVVEANRAEIDEYDKQK